MKDSKILNGLDTVQMYETIAAIKKQPEVAEFLLHALAGCVTTTLVLHAAARGIRIDEISTKLEGDVDLHGLLGLDDSVTPGYEQIRVKMDVKADCSDEELDDLLAFAQERSPMYQTISRPVPVRVERVASAPIR